jgi:hypothetical protein
LAGTKADRLVHVSLSRSPERVSLRLMVDRQPVNGGGELDWSMLVAEVRRQP